MTNRAHDIRRHDLRRRFALVGTRAAKRRPDSVLPGRCRGHPRAHDPGSGSTERRGRTRRHGRSDRGLHRRVRVERKGVQRCLSCPMPVTWRSARRGRRIPYFRSKFRGRSTTNLSRASGRCWLTKRLHARCQSRRSPHGRRHSSGPIVRLTGHTSRGRTPATRAEQSANGGKPNGWRAMSVPNGRPRSPPESRDPHGVSENRS